MAVGNYINGKRTAKIAYDMMLQLNMVIIIYVGLISMFSVWGIIKRQDALSLITRTGVLPMESWKDLVLGLGFYICFLILLTVTTKNISAFFCKILLEITLGIMVCITLHMGYRGIIFLIMADTIKYTQDNMKRVRVLVVLCGVYLLLDEKIISLIHPIVPLQTMWMFYDQHQQAVLMLVLSVLNALNLFLFISYIVIMFLNQMSERKRIMKLYQELEVKNEQLIAYANELEAATQLKERNRLAREIHDTLGHSLTGITTGIDACVMLMDVAPEATKQQLKAIAEVARQGIKDVRRSINALRPDALEHINLKHALEQMVEETSRSTGVEIRFICPLELKIFTKDEEDIIYRIVQESITNGIRHGKASHIDVNISRENSVLSIDICDNGIGCKDVKKGFGLYHMEERLQMLNGQLEYKGDNGFELHAKIPIRWGGGEDK